MATTLDELVIKLSAQNDQLLSALKTSQKQTDASMKNMEKAVNEFSKNSNKSLSGFETAMATMAGVVGGAIVTGAFELLKSAASAAFGELKNGINEAAEGEAAMSRLTFAFAQAGQNATKSAGAFDTFAKEIQRTTAIEDDAVIASGALIESLARLDEKGLEKATRAAIDMSVALGIDLETATRAVGKAAQGEVSGLARYGIVIKETGDKSIDAAKALDILKQRFGGSAANQINTFSGALQQTKNSYGGMLEGMGEVITRNPVIIKLLNQAAISFAELSVWIEKNKKVLMEYVGEGLLTLIDVLQNRVLPVLSAGYEYLQFVITGWVQFGKVVGAVAASIVQAVQGNFSEAGEIIKTQLIDSFTAMKSTFKSGDNIFDTMTTKLGDFKVAAEVGMKILESGTIAAKDGLDGTDKKIKEMAVSMKSLQDINVSMAQGLVDQSQSLQEQMDFQLQIITDNHANHLMSDEEFFIQKAAITQAFYDQEQATLNSMLAKNDMTKQTYAAASIQLTQNQMLAERKIAAEKQKALEQDEKLKQQVIGSSLGNIATLTQTHNKGLQAIGKAAAIAQATWNTYAGASNAMRDVPYPFNIAAAASVVVAGMVNVAKIKSTKAARGIDSVPGIGTGDNFPAILAAGERVVPSETNKDLTAFLKDINRGAAGGMQNVRIELSLKDDLIEMIEARLIERKRNGISLGLV